MNKAIGSLSLFTFVLPLYQLTLYHTILTFDDPENELLKKLWEKEKMLVTSIFSFLQSFLPVPKHISIIQSYLFCHLQNAFNLDQYENLVKELTIM